MRGQPRYHIPAVCEVVRTPVLESQDETESPLLRENRCRSELWCRRIQPGRWESDQTHCRTVGSSCIGDPAEAGFDHVARPYRLHRAAAGPEESLCPNPVLGRCGGDRPDERPGGLSLPHAPAACDSILRRQGCSPARIARRWGLRVQQQLQALRRGVLVLCRLGRVQHPGHARQDRPQAGGGPVRRDHPPGGPDLRRQRQSRHHARAGNSHSCQRD